MKPMIGAGVPLDLPRLLETRMLVTANSGGGKSWLLRRILEQTAGQVQQLVIDPEGEFSTLREKHDYVIAAPHDGDAVAHPRTAGLLARRLLETGVSAILDVYDLKAHERQAFVRVFLEAVVNAPKALWHPVLIVLDEAHVYCPETGSAEAMPAVVDLATRGRKRGFCLVAATQRLSKLKKDAAAELLNKLIGRTGLDIDVKRAADELGMTGKEAVTTLRNLKPGEFFAFGPALSTEVKAVTVGDVETTHPKAGKRLLQAPPKPTAAIKAILPKLADLPKEAEQEARTAEDLKRQLAQARRELTQVRKAQPAPKGDPAAARRAAATIARVRRVLEDVMKFIVSINAKDFAAKAGETVDPADIEKAITAAVEQAMKLVTAGQERRNREIMALQKQGTNLVQRIQSLTADTELKVEVDVRHNEPHTVTPKKSWPPHVPARLLDKTASRPSLASGNGHLPPGERAVLEACIQYPDGLERSQLTVLTGYKRSSRDAYIARLAAKGYVDVLSNAIAATDAGRDALPDARPLPTGEELREFWRDRLPEGERKVLDVLIESYPHGLERGQLDEQTGYKRSSRDAYISRLAAKELVTEPQRGVVRASEVLFQ